MCSDSCPTIIADSFKYALVLRAQFTAERHTRVNAADKDLTRQQLEYTMLTIQVSVCLNMHSLPLRIVRSRVRSPAGTAH